MCLHACMCVLNSKAAYVNVVPTSVVSKDLHEVHAYTFSALIKIFYICDRLFKTRHVCIMVDFQFLYKTQAEVMNLPVTKFYIDN